MTNNLSKHAVKLELAAVFLLCFSVTFCFNGLKPKWLWSNYSLAVVVLLILILVTLSARIRIKKAKVDDLIQQIEQSNQRNRLRRD
jgi:hypothetical protein